MNELVVALLLGAVGGLPIGLKKWREEKEPDRRTARLPKTLITNAKAPNAAGTLGANSLFTRRGSLWGD